MISPISANPAAQLEKGKHQRNLVGARPTFFWFNCHPYVERCRVYDPTLFSVATFLVPHRRCWRDFAHTYGAHFLICQTIHLLVEPFGERVGSFNGLDGFKL